MKSIKLLLVGDVHFPDVKSILASADYKDTAYPEGLAEISLPDRLANVARTIAKMREEDNDIVGILLCGDLTSRGDLDGYRDCVAYLDRVLQLSNSSIWKTDQIHIVPGNHDVNRALCAGATDYFAKFDPLVEAWSVGGDRICTSKGLRHTTLSKDKIGVDVISLNSCVGCGEKRFLPERVRESLSDMFMEAIRDDPRKGFALVGEQLDTPAFAEVDISEAVSVIQKMDANRLPIILAHHNILPQASPRIDLYTEAINGGLVRSRLTKCTRPLIYCHGHIHTDPIEIISTPGNRDGCLISLSIPQLTDGFDVLELQFSHTDRPLGAIIRRHRLQNDGGVINIDEKTARIPLCIGDPSKYIDDRMKSVVHAIKPGAYKRFPDICKSLQRLKPKMSSQKVASYLLEAEWLGIVQINNRAGEPIVWHVRNNQS